MIRDPELHKKAITKILNFARSIGLYPEKLTLSKPRGPKGNKEFLVLLSQNPEDDKVNEENIKNAIEMED